jgi:hypothetical protein
LKAAIQRRFWEGLLGLVIQDLLTQQDLDRWLMPVVEAGVVLNSVDGPVVAVIGTVKLCWLSTGVVKACVSCLTLRSTRVYDIYDGSSRKFMHSEFAYLLELGQ